MAKKDYTKFSKEAETVTAEPQEDVTEVIEEVVEPVEFTEEVEALAVINGVVANCKRLNVRRKPEKTAEILTIIEEGTAVTINDSLSSEDFYSVTVELPDGATMVGYCMKQYIKIE